ncbi:hypothetical protein ACFRAO_42855 [Streptomyces sp. NPDC056656]|uniref:hypothetical protein n=1 Tax=Streptomyces sp. NPDC056656 TaxID=3345895 RepID=UPI0036972BDF
MSIETPTRPHSADLGDDEAAEADETQVVTGRREALFGAWGRVTERFWDRDGRTENATGQLPADTIRFRIEEVASAANAGDFDTAVTLVSQLDRDTAEAYTEAHMYTVQVREVRGYVARLTGDFTTGLAYYLHAARLRAGIQGPGHPDVEQATRRAFSLWWAMPPTGEKQQWGTELLTAVTAIHGEDAPVVRHTVAALYSHMLPTAVSSGLMDRTTAMPAIAPSQNEGNEVH